VVFIFSGSENSTPPFISFRRLPCIHERIPALVLLTWCIDRRLIAYRPIPGKQAAILQKSSILDAILEVRISGEGIERNNSWIRCSVLLDLGQGHVFSPPVARTRHSVTRETHWRI